MSLFRHKKPTQHIPTSNFAVLLNGFVELGIVGSIVAMEYINKRYSTPQTNTKTYPNHLIDSQDKSL